MKCLNTFRYAVFVLCSIATLSLAQTTKSTQIVGGTTAAKGAWPWTSLVLVSLGDNLYKMCGGTLVSKNKVITAAHCVIDTATNKVYSTSLATVRLGDVSMTGSDMVVHSVSSIVTHPSYDHATSWNDIAVLTLSDSSSQTTLQPADFSPADGSNVTVVGWGNTAYQGTSSSTLLQATVQVIPRATCISNYLSGNYASNNAYEICAGKLSGGVDACNGDSGGPLMYQLPDGSWRLVGIVSWGNGCALANYPGWYTNVSRYRAFLESQGINFWKAAGAPSIAIPATIE